MRLHLIKDYQPCIDIPATSQNCHHHVLFEVSHTLFDRQTLQRFMTTNLYSYFLPRLPWHLIASACGEELVGYLCTVQHHQVENDMQLVPSLSSWLEVISIPGIQCIK